MKFDVPIKCTGCGVRMGRHSPVRVGKILLCSVECPHCGLVGPNLEVDPDAPEDQVRETFADEVVPE